MPHLLKSVFIPKMKAPVVHSIPVNEKGKNELKDQGNCSNFNKVKVNVVANWVKNKKINSFSRGSVVPIGWRIETIPSSRQLKSFDVYLTSEDKVSSVNDYNKSLPDKIEGTYKYDFNIMDIHDLILKRFQYQKNHKLVTLQEKLSVEKNKIKWSQNMIGRKT